MDERAKPFAISEKAARMMEERHRDGNNLRWWTLPKEAMSELCATPNSKGVRVSMGRNADGIPCPIFRAVDGKGNPIEGAAVFEQAVPCPPFCS